MASEQLTKDVITLKGSAAIVSEFLLYSGMCSMIWDRIDCIMNSLLGDFRPQICSKALLKALGFP